MFEQPGPDIVYIMKGFMVIQQVLDVIQKHTEYKHEIQPCWYDCYWAITSKSFSQGGEAGVVFKMN